MQANMLINRNAQLKIILKFWSK